MTRNDKLVEKLRMQMSQILRMHVEHYFEMHFAERNLETARYFLNANYQEYITQITEIFLNGMASSNPGNDFKLAMLEEARHSIGLLFSEIILESTNGS